MTVTVAQIRVRFPEFEDSSVTPDALIEMLIDEAESRTPSSIWGDKEDAGVRYLTAHLLALSPQARELKLSTPDGNSNYLPERKRLEAIVASGFRIATPTTGIEP